MKRTGPGSDTDRNCPECGDPIIQRPDEKNNKFKVRKTCGKPGCRSKSGGRKGGRQPRKTVIQEKECHWEGCTNLLKRADAPSNAAFTKRKYCDEHVRESLRTSQTIELPPKTCPICSTVFSRNPSKESTTSFKERVTCGKNSCRALYVAQKKTEGKPTRHCALSTCDTILKTGQARYCCRDHKNDDQRVPDDQKAPKKRPEPKPRPLKPPKPPRQVKKKTNLIVSKPKPRNPELTVFGDKPTDMIWRPAALGGPYRRVSA